MEKGEAGGKREWVREVEGGGRRKEVERGREQGREVERGREEGREMEEGRGVDGKKLRCGKKERRGEGR